MTLTPTPCRTIPVALGEQAYPIVIGSGLLASLGERIAALGYRPGTRVLVVSNPVVHGHYGTAVLASL